MLYSNKDLKKLIIPLVFEQLLSLLVGLADTIMISVVGEAAVSGVSLVDTVNVLIINVFVALGTGGAVVAGHYLGQKDPENAGRAAWQVNLFSAFSAIVVTILFMVFHDGLLRLMFGQVETAVMENAKSYLLITALSILPLAVYNACAALFRAMGDSRTTLYISILMNVINIVGNAILIYGADMGTAGAATATTVSRIVAAVLIFVMMFQKKRIINFRGKVIWRFEPVMIRKILYIGVPNSLENSLFQLGKILTLSMVSTYGTYAIAANAVCNTLAAFNMLPGLAINSAILAIVSVCIGAGEREQARYYTKKLMKLANLTLIVMSALIIASSGALMSLYHLSPEATKLGQQVLIYHAVMAVFFWIPSFSLPNAFRAAGDVMWPMVIAILSMWVFRLALSYILGTVCEIGLMGVWIAMSVDWIFRAICYMIRFRGDKWERQMS